MKIKMNLIGDVNCFIQGCRFYEGEIIMEQGSQRINAKSIIGVYSLDLSQPVEVTIKSDRKDIEEQFYNFIRKWETD